MALQIRLLFVAFWHLEEAFGKRPRASTIIVQGKTVLYYTTHGGRAN